MPSKETFYILKCINLSFYHSVVVSSRAFIVIHLERFDKFHFQEIKLNELFVAS